jgi:hypothetical protein
MVTGFGGALARMFATPDPLVDKALVQKLHHAHANYIVLASDHIYHELRQSCSTIASQPT